MPRHKPRGYITRRGYSTPSGIWVCEPPNFPSNRTKSISLDYKSNGDKLMNMTEEEATKAVDIVKERLKALNDAVDKAFDAARNADFDGSESTHLWSEYRRLREKLEKGNADF